MSESLLATKIRIPPVHRNLVRRPQLIQRLNDGIAQDTRLILISAPAGYGKSTLLGDWVSQMDVPVAWLSFEKGENTPARFWSYFGAALDTVLPLRKAGLGDVILQRMGSPQPASMEALLTDLVNDLTTLESEAVLVLDDLQAITESQIHQDLVFLIEHLPQSGDRLHLVVASRRDPPWPLARWRGRDQLVEIRTGDLRFNPEEATDFLNRVMQLRLSAGDVHLLEDRTEGWIAGLQMAALSLQGRQDVQEFIQAFTGSHRYIFDYLVEEVLSRQEPEVQDFLLKTSILERLSAPLCDAIRGQTDSRAILDQLDRTDLFLVPLDDERNWYRYHLLFTDLLLASLKKSHPEILPALHRGAAAWFEEQGYLPEALAHALAAGDLDGMAKLVEGYAFTILEVQEASSLLSWLNSLPNSVTSSFPWLSVARAWLLAYLGRNDQIEPAIGMAEETADPADQRIQGYIAAMRTLACELNGPQIDAGTLQARKALELLPQDEFRPRAFVCYHLANILAWQGDSAGGQKALEEATALSLSAGDLEMAMTAQFEIANMLRFQGRLRVSSHTFERTHQMTARYIPERRLKSLPVGFAYLQQAYIYLDRNELDKTLQFAQEGMRICKLWGYADYLYEGWIRFASILYETGDQDGALSALGEAKRIFPKIPPGNRILGLEALINQARGDWRSTAAWLLSCGMSSNDFPDFIHRFDYYLFAAIMEEQGKLDEAGRLFERLRVVVERAGAITMLIDILVHQAMIAFNSGDQEKALSFLQRALQLAEPEGFIRVFLSKGSSMQQLLRRAITAGISPDYARVLLERFPQPGEKVRCEPIQSYPAKDGQETSLLIEPLSDRELEVLRLLNTSLDSNEIAAELYISVNTVRTHIKNIYSKLDVNRRMQAVERAHELKLL